jgi:putative transposase
MSSAPPGGCGTDHGCEDSIRGAAMTERDVVNCADQIPRVSLLKTPKGRESTGIFAAQSYRRRHDCSSVRHSLLLFRVSSRASLELERDESVRNRKGIRLGAWDLIQPAGWARRPAGMAKPYSMDLCKRVVEAVERDGLSCNQAAARFDVAISTAIGWMNRYRETGSVAPGQIGGYRPKKLVGEYRDWLLKRCREREFTLRGLVGELAERGLGVDYRVVWAFVHEEKLSYADRQRARSPRRGAAASAMGVSERLCTVVPWVT